LQIPCLILQVTVRRQKTDVEPVVEVPDTGVKRVRARSMTFDNTISSFGFHLGLPRVNTPEQVLEQEPEVDSARVVRTLTLDMLKA
jgi:hypothetical protein